MNPSLLFIMASLLTWGIGEGMFFIFQPIYLQELGADTMTIAGIFSAFGMAMMVAHIPAGYLSDRLGRRPLLILAWTFGMLATWVMALARSLPFFVVGMLLYGLTAFVSSPLNSYVTAARGKFTPARAMTLTSAAFNVGAILGPVLGGWIGEHLSLRTVYLVAGCLFILSTSLLFFTRPQPTETHDTESPPAKLWNNRRYMGFLVVIFVAMFIMYLPQPLTPRFLQNERGLSLTAVGTIGSIGSLGNATMNLLLGSLPAWLAFLLAQASAGLFALLMWLGTGQFWFGLGYFLLGGYRAARPLVFAQIRVFIHETQMGLAYGIAETVNAFTVILAPLLAGILYTRDPLMVYWVSLGLTAAAVVVSGIVSPRRREPLPVPAPVEIHQPPME